MSDRRILLVEDNSDYFMAALGEADRRGIALDYVPDYACAARLLEGVALGERDLHGALVDCFFPEETGTGKRDLGRQVVERIAGHYPRPGEQAKEVLDRFREIIEVDEELEKYLTRWALAAHGVNLQGGLDTNPTFRAVERVGRVLGREAGAHIAKNSFGMIYRDGSSAAREAAKNQPRDYYGDLMAAIEADPSNQPLGVEVAERLDEKGIPFVLATSTYHHDSLTQPICDYASKRGWSVLDCGLDRPEEKATPEFWRQAYNELERKIGRLE